MDITHDWINDDDPENGIPVISDKELFERNSLFTFLHHDEDGEMFIVDMPLNDIEKLKKMSCIWDAKKSEKEKFALEPGIQFQVPFFVSCGYHGIFKPSIYEVLSQSPIDKLVEEGYNAFYIGNHIQILKSGGYQKATAFFVKIEKSV